MSRFAHEAVSKREARGFEGEEEEESREERGKEDDGRFNEERWESDERRETRND